MGIVLCRSYCGVLSSLASNAEKGYSLIKLSYIQAGIAIVAIICLTVLVAFHDVSSDVAVPIFTAIAGGGLGHVNGYSQGARAEKTQ